MSRFPLWIGAVSGSTRTYSRGDYAALPADDTDLETAFTSGEYTQVDTDDADRVAQTATDQFAIFQFRDDAGANTSASPTCNVQSDLAPSSSPVLLQVYNQNSTTWETLDTESSAAANTDFDLTGTVANLTNYKDGSGWVSFRVYQEAQ